MNFIIKLQIFKAYKMDAYNWVTIIFFPLPQIETNNFKNSNIVHVYSITYIKSGRLINILVNISVMLSVQNMIHKID